MTDALGDGESKMVQKTVAEIFWAATRDEGKERTPVQVVQHALANIKAFDEGEVLNLAGERPMSLMDLMANSGLEEDLVYASPELARGEAVDERSLVFSLGVLIFERLTGRHPFGASDNSSRVARLRRYEMGSGVNFIPSLPKGLREILMRAMGPFPEERYMTLDEMMVDLVRFVENKYWADPNPQFTPAASPQKQSKFLEAPTVVAEPLFDVSSGVHKIPIEKKGAQLQAVLAGSRSAPQSSAPQSSAPQSSAPQSSPPRSFAPEKTAEATRSNDIFADLPEEWAPDAQAQQQRESPTVPEMQISTGGDGSRSTPVAPPSRPRAVGAPAPLRNESTALVSSAVSKVRSPSGTVSFGRWSPIAFILIGAGLASLFFMILLSLQKRQVQPLSYHAASQVAPPSEQLAPASKGASVREPTKVKEDPASNVGQQSALTQARPSQSPSSPPVPAPVVQPLPVTAAAVQPTPITAPVAQAKADVSSPSPSEHSATAKAPVPTPSPANISGFQPETFAGLQVARLIRDCGLSGRGNRALRVAVNINPPNKILRVFANLKQGLTVKQVQCIRKAVTGHTLALNWTKPGYMEWSMKFSPAGETSKVAGPRPLLERMKRGK